jgi:hypothetical protein
MRPWIVAWSLWALACGAGGAGQDGGVDAAGWTDAGVLAADGGGAGDGGWPDGGADGGQSSLAACTFNADCIAQERCECELSSGCACRLGARGTGLQGVDGCTDGNDCATSLCVEGHPDDTYFCSGPCAGDADCGPNLPRCIFIGYLDARICVRS